MVSTFAQSTGVGYDHEGQGAERSYIDLERQGAGKARQRRTMRIRMALPSSSVAGCGLTSCGGGAGLNHTASERLLLCS